MDHLAAEKHERGRDIIVAVDKVHLLSADQLEQLRFLTNGETDSVAPFTGLVLRQPTPGRRIKLGSFAALDQRIALRYTLSDMTDNETPTTWVTTSNCRGEPVIQPAVRGVLVRHSRRAAACPTRV